MKNSGSKFCYIDFEIDGKKCDRVLLELFHSSCPNTSDNFLALCNGFSNSDKEKVSYQGTTINRVVKDGYIQGGDIAKLGLSKIMNNTNRRSKIHF